MFIININIDAHRKLMVALNKIGVKTKIVWSRGVESCHEPLTYEDYSRAKDVQIMLDRTTNGVPCV